jgi:hypothetical protein
LGAVSLISVKKLFFHILFNFHFFAEKRDRVAAAFLHSHFKLLAGCSEPHRKSLISFSREHQLIAFILKKDEVVCFKHIGKVKLYFWKVNVCTTELVFLGKVQLTLPKFCKEKIEEWVQSFAQDDQRRFFNGISARIISVSRTVLSAAGLPDVII